MCRFRLTHKVALAALFSLIFFTFILTYINYSATAQTSHLPVRTVQRLIGSIPEHVETSPHPSGPSCPPGFYTEKELKPHLRRPPQDPSAPGANGRPYVPGLMTPDEHKEELRGFDKNQFNQFVSDRISVHRDLGKDTRPLE